MSHFLLISTNPLTNSHSLLLCTLLIVLHSIALQLMLRRINCCILKTMVKFQGTNVKKTKFVKDFFWHVLMFWRDVLNKIEYPWKNVPPFMLYGWLASDIEWCSRGWPFSNYQLCSCVWVIQGVWDQVV